MHNIASKRPSQLFCNNNHSSRRLDLLLFSFPTARIHFICFSIWNVVIWQVWDSVWPEIDFLYSWPMNPFPLASFLSSSPRFFGRRRKQLFIFVKRCAQTPVFQWQLAFSQIGAKNGQNWQYRVTGKQPLHLNISKSNLIWYLLRFSWRGSVLYKGTNSSLKKTNVCQMNVLL